MIGNSPISNASGMQASMLLNPLSNDLQGLLGDEMEPRDLFSKRMSGSIISYGIGITDTFAFESKHKISDKDKDDMNLNPELLSIVYLIFFFFKYMLFCRKKLQDHQVILGWKIN